MAAERATAAEMMAPAAAVVMVGVMLGLGRVGGGSGWRQRVSGTMSSVAAVQSSVAAVQSSVAAEAPGWFTSVIGGEVLHLTSESLP